MPGDPIWNPLVVMSPPPPTPAANTCLGTTVRGHNCARKISAYNMEQVSYHVIINRPPYTLPKVLL